MNVFTMKIRNEKNDKTLYNIKYQLIELSNLSKRLKTWIEEREH